MKTLLALALLLATGCYKQQLQLPIFKDGKIVGYAISDSTSFGTNKKLVGLELSYDDMTFRVKGYESDQVALVKEIKDAVLAGAAAAAKP